MKKLLQINICSNVLSTGRICEDIAKIARLNGWDTYIAYGNSHKPSISKEYKVAGKWNKYLHYLEFRLFDREGLGSRTVTRRLIQWISEINPDIIHLHNIHDHWLNYPILFRYLAKIHKPIVWTQHDCWSFTGGCMYFDMFDCTQWKNGCISCPENRAFFCNRAKKNLILKNSLFEEIKSLTFVPVSNWLSNLLHQSTQKNRDIITIHNGIDVHKFYPLKKTSSKFTVLGVAAVWDARKGFSDFIRLRESLPNDVDIILVGVSDKQKSELPLGITGVTRTSNIEDLVEIYSKADVFVNPTYSDNFPTTNIESLACGTPVITYNTGGSPEAIDDRTGVVVKQGDVETLAKAILTMKMNPLSSEDCRNRALSCFDRDKCYEKYIQLYSELINRDD